MLSEDVDRRHPGWAPIVGPHMMALPWGVAELLSAPFPCLSDGADGHPSFLTP